MTETLLRRLQELQTAELTRQAINDYCLALDTGDFGLLERTFNDEIVLGLPGGDTVSGIDAVLAFFREATAKTVTHRKHFTTNVTIRHCDGTTASGESYFMSLLGDPGDLVLAWGRFLFEARLSADSVEITRLDLVIEQTPAPVSFLATGA